MEKIVIIFIGGYYTVQTNEDGNIGTFTKIVPSLTNK